MNCEWEISGPVARKVGQRKRGGRAGSGERAGSRLRERADGNQGPRSELRESSTVPEAEVPAFQAGDRLGTEGRAPISNKQFPLRSQVQGEARRASGCGQQRGAVTEPRED